MLYHHLSHISDIAMKENFLLQKARLYLYLFVKTFFREDIPEPHRVLHLCKDHVEVVAHAQMFQYAGSIL